MGLGRSGLAAARHCLDRGASVAACDTRPAGELSDAVEQLSCAGADVVLGSNDASLAEGADLIVASPGVPLDLPLLAKAGAGGVPVVGEMELAVREIRRPIAAVTGTNGKTTTTALLGHLLAGAGLSVCVAGNIGNPIVASIEEANRSDWVVLEVSSFQLDTAPSLRADIAVWLNATQDHIDRHGSFDAYVASKAKLFAQIADGGRGIYNACDHAVAAAAAASSAGMIPFDAEGALSEDLGDRGWYEDGALKVRLSGREHGYPLEGVALQGAHNRENMLAALLAAELAGSDYDLLGSALKSFRGLAHRMELVLESSGVSYYDDSKGTNVGATLRAINGFSRPVVLIAGGQSKGADLSQLVPAIRERVKGAVLIGEAADEMERIFSKATKTMRADDMGEAVTKAAGMAESGDVVLLSPACASLDMFKDYAERGDAFKEAVNKLIADR